MAQWDELTAKSKGVIESARQYLARREADKPGEIHLIKDWSKRVDDLQRDLASVEAVYASNTIQPRVSPNDEPLHRLVSQHLDFVQYQLGEFHEYYDPVNVELVLGTLEHALNTFMSVGPHGPGGGRPGGGPRGR